MATAPDDNGRLYGLAAEFARADALSDAAQRAYAAGYRRIDAYSPFPIEGLAERMGFQERLLPKLMLAGGLIGAALGFGGQVYVNLDYPLNVGGRPLLATEAFMMITFELMVLFAVLFVMVGMFALNRLPRLHHPMFGLERFHRATQDRFFLFVSCEDGQFDAEATRSFLDSLAPERVDAVLAERGR